MIRTIIQASQNVAGVHEISFVLQHLLQSSAYPKTEVHIPDIDVSMEKELPGLIAVQPAGDPPTQSHEDHD
jgi:hypothetical protein